MPEEFIMEEEGVSGVGGRRDSLITFCKVGRRGCGVSLGKGVGRGFNNLGGGVWIELV